MGEIKFSFRTEKFKLNISNKRTWVWKCKMCSFGPSDVSVLPCLTAPSASRPNTASGVRVTPGSRPSSPAFRATSPSSFWPSRPTGCSSTTGHWGSSTLGRRKTSSLSVSLLLWRRWAKPQQFELKNKTETVWKDFSITEKLIIKSQ